MRKAIGFAAILEDVERSRIENFRVTNETTCGVAADDQNLAVLQ